MGRKFSPIHDRLKTYRALRKLVDQGGYNGAADFARELRTTGCSLPSRETIRRWALKKTSPFSGKRLFEPRPSEELIFFLGAWIGDGWGDENDGGKRMLLKVRSCDFAKEFADCAAKILGKTDSYWVRRMSDKKGRWYLVKVTSFMLYEFANKPLDELCEWIVPFPKGFLRGFFTAEGNPSVSLSQRGGPRLDVCLELSNSDYPLLDLSRKLLLVLGYSPTRTRMVQPAGAVTNLGVATTPCWLLNLPRFGDVRTFATSIGFADSTKQTKLTDAISLIGGLGPRGAAIEWTRLYEKHHGDWVKK